MYLWSLSHTLPYLTQSGAGQRICSKTGNAEGCINGIKNIKSALWVHLCLAWKMGAIKMYYLKTEYAVHLISGTVEGNDATAFMWEGYQLEHTSILLWSHYSDGTKLQLEDVLSQVIDILFHSLGPLASVLSAANWLLRNIKEGTPISVIKTPSEVFGIVGFAISITWSWILKQWREFNKGSTMVFLADEWVTPDFGTRHQGEILHATVNYKH